MTVIGIRRAVTDDLPAMKTLVDWGAGLGELVPQTFSALKSRVEHFLVATDGDHVIGVCALRPVDHEAGELCSLVIRPDYQRRGLGGRLVKACLAMAGGQGIRLVIALTFHPEYFEQFGFRRIENEQVPSPIWQIYAEPDTRLSGSETALRYELGDV